MTIVFLLRPSWKAYRNPFDRFGIEVVPFVVFQATQTISCAPLQIPFDIIMRIPVLVVDPSTFLCYLFHCVPAFRGGLVIGFRSDLPLHEALGGLGGFGLGINIGREDTEYFPRVFRCKL